MNSNTATGQPPAIFHGRVAENQALVDFRHIFLAATSLQEALQAIAQQRRQAGSPEAAKSGPNSATQMASALWLLHLMESRAQKDPATKAIDDGTFQMMIIDKLPRWYKADWQLLRAHLLELMAKAPATPAPAEVTHGA